MSASCRKIACLVATYLDGELEASQLLEVESHAVGCPACAERIALDRAVRCAVRRTARRTCATAALRARIAASMAAERARQDAAAPLAGPRLVPLRHVMPLAAAAAFALFAGWSARHGAPETAGVPTATAPQTADMDQLLNQFVDWHARPLPPEVTRPEDLPGFEPYVGVPVRPPRLAVFGARLVGGRMLPLAVREQERAAMLQYTMMSGHRVSVYVYDPHRVHMAPSQLHPRVTGPAGEPEVWAGQVRGYSVAAAVRRDVGYAVATDLDEDESVELAMAAAP